MTRYIEIPNLDDLRARYVAGEPEHKLAREAGVNRWTFRRRLLESGIEPRNVSESMFIRWSHATPEERARMLDNAHVATRGREVTMSEKELKVQNQRG